MSATPCLQSFPTGHEQVDVRVSDAETTVSYISVP